MTEHDDAIIQVVTERFERRLAEESGKLRVDLAKGFGELRAEVADRNAELLKWGLIFGATQTAAIAAVMMAIR